MRAMGGLGRVAVAVALGLVSGCGGSHAGPHPLRAAALSDDAVELAALLPDGADRCVVARPAKLADRRRALVLVHSWAEPLAWARDLGVVAYATAVAEDSRGRRARRTYARFAGPGEGWGC